jgi:serine/threonine protein kinase
MERLRAGDPEQIGPWQIINRLGSGGMGIVYMGTNGTRAAAIKVVRDFLLEDPASRTRIAREVDTLLRVKSPYVAEIVGSDVNGNPAWIATDYVDGPSLKTLIEKEGPLPFDQWLEFAKGFLSAVAAVHSVSVVHRDIKPSNILISKAGPKLIDFGISFTNDATSLTGTGMVAGTPAWLAPEQFLGREITVAVDNFAAGSTLMYAATGKVPWGAEDSSVGAVMHTILVEEPDTSLLTEFQIEIITPLLVKDAASRKTASQILKKIGDGPRGTQKINTVSKKTTAPAGESFLDKARKSDTEAKRKQAEDEEKRKQAEEAAAVREAERKRKEEEKAAKKAAKSAAKSDDKGTSPAVTKKPLNVKLIGGALAGVVLVAGAIFALTSGSKDPVAPPVETKYQWTALIAGESKVQSGQSTTFLLYVCDQGVIAKSLKVSSISARPAGAGQIGVSVKRGDARCGKDFDTIFVKGTEASQSGSVNYFVSGTTESNYDFRYDFTVTIVPQ